MGRTVAEIRAERIRTIDAILAVLQKDRVRLEASIASYVKEKDQHYANMYDGPTTHAERAAEAGYDPADPKARNL